MLNVPLEVRKINAAIDQNLFGRGGGVYCMCADGSRHRIRSAKIVRGALVVRSLYGQWLQPVSIDKEW